MRTVQTAPTWFALQILLLGVQHRKDAACKASYWSSLLGPGDSLICRLEAELFHAYGELKDPPQIHQDIHGFAKQLLALRESQLEGVELTEFEEMAQKALAQVSQQLESRISW